MSAPTLHPMSEEEYLRTEAKSPVKREYVGGFVYPLHGLTRGQAGTTDRHMQICMNIAHALFIAARRAGCRLYQSDMRLRIEQTSTYYYPDVMAICTTELVNPEATYRVAPCLLIEVTSKSTAQNDRLAKYAAYTALPSLHTYLIVEQAQRRVYAYSRSAAGWQLDDLVDQGTVYLPCLSHSLSLGDIYADVPVN